MNFTDLLNYLRQKNKGIIIFINVGAFYIAIEEDAVFLNKKIKLKCTCFQKHTCKVGVPIKAINKYLEKIEKLGYGYIVYNLDKQKQKIDIIKKYKGKRHKTEKKNKNCLLCKGIDINKDNDYAKALEKLCREQENEGE